MFKNSLGKIFEMFALIPASKEAINEKNSATCGMCDKYYNNIL